MYAYSGELEVADGVFILDADRIVIRDGEVAFMLSGTDDDGEFNAQGIAILTSRDAYAANQVKVDYQGFGKVDYATIQFSVVRQTSKKLRCYIEGKWIEGEDGWAFSGNLKKYKQKQN